MRLTIGVSIWCCLALCVVGCDTLHQYHGRVLVAGTAHGIEVGDSLPNSAGEPIPGAVVTITYGVSYRSPLVIVSDSVGAVNGNALDEPSRRKVIRVSASGFGAESLAWKEGLLTSQTRFVALLRRAISTDRRQ